MEIILPRTEVTLPVEILIDLLITAGFSQREIAEKLGVTGPLVGHWKSHRRNITAQEYIGLLRLLFAKETLQRLTQSIRQYPLAMPILGMQALVALQKQNAFVKQLHDDLQTITQELASITQKPLGEWNAKRFYALAELLAEKTQYVALLQAVFDAELTKAWNDLCQAYHDLVAKVINA